MVVADDKCVGSAAAVEEVDRDAIGVFRLPGLRDAKSSGRRHERQLLARIEGETVPLERLAESIQPQADGRNAMSSSISTTSFAPSDNTASVVMRMPASLSVE